MALTVLISAGLSAVSLVSSALRNEAELAAREETLREADRVLASLTLSTRVDLDQRLGRHPYSKFRADIRRPEPTLYRIALLEADTGHLELLVTVVYRPRETSP
jgi:hypothetical protein